MKTALHRINLNVIGGVERLFNNFVGLSDSMAHHVVLNQAVHPFLEKVQRAKLHTVKWRGGKKLWRHQRRSHARKIYQSIDARAMIYWDMEERHLELIRRRKGDTPLFFYDHGHSWLTQKERRFREFLRHVDGCIACSHASKRNLELRWGVSAPIEVIKNPLRPDLLPTGAEPKRVPTNRPLHIGCVGRLVPVKAHCLALYTIYELGKRGIDVRLSIAGGGRCEPSLRALAKQLGIESRVDFIGCIDDIGTFYQKIDICLCPAICEPFGLISIEAQAFGCIPVVAYVDGLAETIVNGKTGIGIVPSLEHDQFADFGIESKGLPKFIYDPIEDRLHSPNVLDPMRVAEAIEQLIERPDQFHAMSQLGIEMVEKEFGFDPYVEKLENLVNTFHARSKPSVQIAHVTHPKVAKRCAKQWQELFGAYLKAPSLHPHRHNTVVIEGRLEGVSCHRAERRAVGLWEVGRLGPLEVRGPLAAWRAKRALEEIAPDLIFYWNCLGPLEPRLVEGQGRAQRVYCDFGADLPIYFLKKMDRCIACSKASMRRLGEHFEGPIDLLPLALSHFPTEIAPKTLKSYRPLALGAFAGFEARAHTLAEQLRGAGYRVSLVIFGSAAPGSGPKCHTLNLNSSGDLEGFLHGIDLLIFDQPENFFPIDVAKAISHGVPVLAPDRGAASEIRGVHVITESDFVKGASKQVVSYLSGRSLELKSAELIEVAREQFSFKAYFDQLAEKIESSVK